MPITYEPIATTTLSSSSSSFTISSIPSTYTDLRIVVVPKSNQNETNMYLRFNSDTGNNYSYTFLSGRFAGGVDVINTFRGTSGGGTGILTDYRGVDTTNLGLITLDVFSYAGSTRKTVLGTSSEDRGNGATSSQVGRMVGLWKSTSAITSVTFSVLGVTTFVAGTTATLYGIKNA
jgi:hypothetical protein